MARSVFPTYLSHFQAIIDNVLKRTHLNLTDQLRLDDRFVHNERHQLVQVGQDQLGLVVRCRGQSGHGVAADLHLRITERSLKHVDKIIPQHRIKPLVVVGERVSESLNRDGPQHQGLISEQGLLDR